jgi:indole-3-glycerol phosphate synthase
MRHVTLPDGGADGDVELIPAVGDSSRMARPELLAEKTEEMRRIAGLSLTEVSPSRRDFTMFVATNKQRIALIPRLKRRDPDTAAEWPDVDVTALARACDETEAAAVAVCTARVYGGSIDDLRRVSEVVSAAVLRDDLCLHAIQLYHARLHGADAVVLPAGQVPFESLRELVAISDSLHMTPVIEVESATEVEVALRLAPAPIGLRLTAADGFVDLHETLRVARGIPSQRTVLLSSEVRDLGNLASLNGLIDAAVVGDALLGAADPAAAIDRFLADG